MALKQVAQILTKADHIDNHVLRNIFSWETVEISCLS